jgi:hypothetical protein
MKQMLVYLQVAHNLKTRRVVLFIKVINIEISKYNVNIQASYYVTYELLNVTSVLTIKQ